MKTHSYGCFRDQFAILPANRSLDLDTLQRFAHEYHLTRHMQRVTRMAWGIEVNVDAMQQNVFARKIDAPQLRVQRRGQHSKEHRRRKPRALGIRFIDMQGVHVARDSRKRRSIFRGESSVELMLHADREISEAVLVHCAANFLWINS